MNEVKTFITALPTTLELASSHLGVDECHIIALHGLHLTQFLLVFLCTTKEPHAQHVNKAFYNTLSPSWKKVALPCLTLRVSGSRISSAYSTSSLRKFSSFIASPMALSS